MNHVKHSSVRSWLWLCVLGVSFLSNLQINAVDVKCKIWNGYTQSIGGSNSKFKNETDGGAVNVSIPTIAISDWSGLYTWAMVSLATPGTGDAMRMYVQTSTGEAPCTGYFHPVTGVQTAGNYTWTAADTAFVAVHGYFQMYWYYGNTYTPSAPGCCINIAVLNSGQFRQKYVLYNDTTLAELDRSGWINPGATYSYAYCGTKIPIQIERLTDSDPVVIDFSVVVATTDPAWWCNDVGGDNSNTDTDNIFGSAPNAPSGGINWPASAPTVSKDETIKRGFEALYGIDRMGFNNILIVNRKINEELVTANSKLDTINTSAGSINTAVGTSNTKLDTLNTTIGTSNTKLDTLNTTIGTSNTKLDTVGTKIDSVSTLVTLGNASLSSLDSKANMLSTINANTVLNYGVLSDLDTKLGTANTTLTTSDGRLAVIMSQGSTANSSLSSLATIETGGNTLLAQILLKAEEIADNTAGAAPAPEVLTNILDEIRMGRTNKTTENAGASNWVGIVQGYADMIDLTNHFKGQQDRFENASATESYGGGEHNWYSFYGESSFAEPARSLWEIAVPAAGGGTRIMDLYPFQYAEIESIAAWIKRFCTYLVVFAAFAFYWKTISNAIEQYILVQQMKADVVDAASFAFFGGTGAARRVVLVAIIAVVTFAGGLWFSNFASRWDFLGESPFGASDSVIAGIMWLVEKFIPLTVIWGLFCSCVTFFFILKAAQFVAQFAWKITPLLFFAFVVNSQAATIRIDNGTDESIHLQIADTTNFGSGIRVTSGASLEVQRNDTIAGTDKATLFRYVSGVWELSSWVNASDYGLESPDVDMIRFGVSANPATISNIAVENSVWWAYGQGWLLGLFLASGGIAIWLIRKIYPRGAPSEL